MENLQLPNEIVLKILGYLSFGELIQCAKVSKRFNAICKDKSLSYSKEILKRNIVMYENYYINFQYFLELQNNQNCDEIFNSEISEINW